MKLLPRPSIRPFGAGLASPLALLFTLVLGIFTSAPRAAPVAALQGPALRVVAPREVRLDQPIELTLIVEGVADVGGYETSLLFDTAAAHFGQLQNHFADMQAFGRGVGQLGEVELAQGVAFGAYSCPVARCTDAGGPLQARGGHGTLRLATVALFPDQAGTLEIRIAATRLVDASGHPIAVAVDPRPIAVQVGPGGAGAPHRAPAADVWAPASVAAAGEGTADLTGEGLVSHADLMEAAIAWTLARERGAPCGAGADLSRDVSRDGCLDIADVQAVAARYSAQRPAPAAVVPSAALTFTVNSTADNGDANIGNNVCATSSGACTLRAAIDEANRHAGPDTIAFNIPGSGVHTIQVGGPLSLSDESGPTTINGYTQPGAAPNTHPLASNARIMVQLEGGGEEAHDGLYITSAGNVIRGLAMYRFHSAIPIYGPGARSNLIAGNFIGTDAAGNYEAPATIGGASGIKPQEGANRNRIGGTALADRNVVSGNGHNGISMYNGGTNSNVVVNNLVGLGPAGNKRLPNRNHGIDVNSAASSNVIGGTRANERNVVSGNGYEGIELSHGRNTANNKILGNFVGTDVTGNAATDYTYNVHFGIRLEDGPSYSEVAYNVVGNNHGGGITLDGFYSFPDSFVFNNKIHDNRVGISLDNRPIPNSEFGIQLDNHAYQNTIGPGNIVAHNPVGIRLISPDTDRNTITKNVLFNNSGLGIDIQPLGWVNQNDAGDRDAGPNEELNFPVITGASTTQVIGSACGGCTVEVFLADLGPGKHGQATRFAGSGVAGSNGGFSVAVSGIAAGSYVSATTTDSNGNTSEFALNFLVSQAIQPTATPTTTGMPTETPIIVPTPTPTVGPAPAPGNKVYLPLLSR